MSDNGTVLTVLESVRCLECDALYSKPSDGGTVRRNPGCPECGYVGWVRTGVLLSVDEPLPRLAGDPPLHPSG